MALTTTEKQLLIRVGADISDLKQRMGEVNTIVAATVGAVEGGEARQQQMVGRTTRVYRGKSGALRDVSQAMTATLAVVGLLGRGNEQLQQTTLALIAALNGVPRVLRLIGRLARVNPLLGWVSILAAVAIAVAQATGLLDKLANKLGLVTAKIPDTTSMLKELFEMSGKRREAAIVDIDAQIEGLRKAGVKEEQLATFRRQKIADLDKKLAEERLAIVREATAQILEAEGRTHQARLLQIEQERQEYIRKTGDRAMAELRAAAQILAAERELAARRAALITESRQAYLQAIGATTAAELEAVRAGLEQRRREIDEAMRAEVLSRKEGARLLIEAEQTAAAERLAIARKFHEDREALFFSHGQKILTAAKATLEVELLAIEESRRKEIRIWEDRLRNDPREAQNVANAIAQIDSAAAVKRVQVFADSIRRMEDNLASLLAAYQQTMADIARLDVDLAEKRARLAGRSDREATQARMQALQAGLARPDLDPQTALEFNRELEQILEGQRDAAVEAKQAAAAAFAATPTAENAQAVYRTTVALAEVQRQLAAVRQQEVDLMEKQRALLASQSTEQKAALTKAQAELATFDQTYSGVLVRLVMGAQGAGQQLLDILGNQVPQALMRARRDAADYIVQYWTSKGIPFVPPQPTGSRGQAPVPAFAGAIGGTGVIIQGNVNNMFQLPDHLRNYDAFGRAVVTVMNEWFAAQRRRSST